MLKYYLLNPVNDSNFLQISDDNPFLLFRNYCKEHNLQNFDDKRIILPDKSLQKLLRIKKSDQLTYFNLQKYMKHHFPKKSVSASVSASASK